MGLCPRHIEALASGKLKPRYCDKCNYLMALEKEKKGKAVYKCTNPNCGLPSVYCKKCKCRMNPVKKKRGRVLYRCPTIGCGAEKVVKTK